VHLDGSERVFSDEFNARAQTLPDQICYKAVVGKGPRVSIVFFRALSDRPKDLYPALMVLMAELCSGARCLFGWQKLVI
jgi:hypothetical protein